LPVEKRVRIDRSQTQVSLHFASLEQAGAVRHAVTTRIGGCSTGAYASANLGLSVGDQREAVLRNRAGAATLVSAQMQHPVTVRQVHGVAALLVDAPGTPGVPIGGADMLLTSTLGPVLLIQVADCVPVIVMDPVRQALALVHAGWRGTAAGAGWEAVAAMQRTFASRPDDLLVGIGPAIGGCCYEVGDDVATEVERASGGPASAVIRRFRNARSHISLAGAIEAQLRMAGVPPNQIEQANLCTACNLDLFYSHRREGMPTGRFGIVAAIQPVGSS
jgi:YfiH family protein